MNKYINKIKDILNNEKKSQNLVIFLVLAFTVVYIGRNIFGKEQIVEASSDNIVVENDVSNLEQKLSNILSQISGVSDVSVMINYSSSNKIIPVYDVKENIDEKVDGTSKNTSSVIEKNVAYQEENGDKVVVVESTELATAEGAIVVGTGVTIGDNMLMIKEAVSSVTGIPTYKVSVFEK